MNLFPLIYQIPLEAVVTVKPLDQSAWFFLVWRSGHLSRDDTYCLSSVQFPFPVTASDFCIPRLCNLAI
jgi:hypothetical protein